MTSSPDTETAWSPLSFPGAAEKRLPASEMQTADTIAPWVCPEVEPRETASPAPPTPAESDPFTTGYEQGLRDGAAQTSRDVQQALAVLRRASEEIQAQRTEQARQLGHYVHTLAVAVAQKIVQREVVADTSIVRGLVERALDLIPVTAPIEVHMNTEDLDSLRAELEEAAQHDPGETIQWLADPALHRGSFLIESPLRVVNGTLDVALRALYERLEYD